MSTSSPITFAIIGAGNRGNGYARYLLSNQQRGRVVAVADPREEYRNALAADHGVPADMVFADWNALAKRGKIADAVIVATPDRLHGAPAQAFARMGCHVLLEKPVAPDLKETVATLSAARESGAIFAVCHVMLYTDYTRAIKLLLDRGAIGDLVSINCVEPVGFWHFAHSFVRGNWRKESDSSFSLLAKSCHDLDWFRHMMGADWNSVSSFGSVAHFHPGNKPAGAGTRCLDCAVEPDCAFSAKRIYLGRAERGDFSWPVSVLTRDLTAKGVTHALETGPYGECVYLGRNDVCDNQTVNISYPGGRTVTFNMSAFTEIGPRRHQLFGTRGEIRGHGETIELYDFATERTRAIDPERFLLSRASSLEEAIDSAAPTESEELDATARGGHGGGDYGLMDSFLSAIETGDPDRVLSGPEESLSSHLLVFAAEQARRRNSVVSRTEFERANTLPRAASGSARGRK